MVKRGGLCVSVAVSALDVGEVLFEKKVLQK
jgi:hypothetical protein